MLYVRPNGTSGWITNLQRAPSCLLVYLIVEFYRNNNFLATRKCLTLNEMVSERNMTLTHSTPLRASSGPEAKARQYFVLLPRSLSIFWHRTLYTDGRRSLNIPTNLNHPRQNLFPTNRLLAHNLRASLKLNLQLPMNDTSPLSVHIHSYCRATEGTIGFANAKI